MIRWMLYGLVGLNLILFSIANISCGDGDEETAPPPEEVSAVKSITIWWSQWAPAGRLDKFAKGFTEKTGIKVEIRQIPRRDLKREVFLKDAAKQFDLVISEPSWLASGAEKGVFLDLTDWLTAPEAGNTIMLDQWGKLCQSPSGSGKFYAAPVRVGPVGFVYRKDWFEDSREQLAFKGLYGRDLTVPADWEEFAQVAGFFTRLEDEKFGCALLTGRGLDSLMVSHNTAVWTFADSWETSKTPRRWGLSPSGDSPQVMTFTRGLLSLCPPGPMFFDVSRSLSAFDKGSVAMAMDYKSLFVGMDERMGEKVGFFDMPRDYGGERDQLTLAGQAASISAKITPERQQAAKKFLTWLLDPKVQRKWLGEGW